MKRITRFEKSSELLGKSLILSSAILGTAIIVSGSIIGCSNEKGKLNTNTDDHNYTKELDSVDDPTPVIIDEKGTDSVQQTPLTNHMDIAKKVADNIVLVDFNMIEDEEIRQECIDDNISNYLAALQIVNENNPLQLEDMTDYTANNYDKLYNKKYNDETVLAYNALAYQRFAENDIDIDVALEELNTLMALQTYPMEIDEATYNKLFANLIRTLDQERHESVYDIYFPLANAIHTLTCSEKHYDDEYAVRCEALDNEFEKIMK